MLDNVPPNFYKGKMMFTLFKKTIEKIILFTKNRNIIRLNGEIVGYMGFDGFIPIKDIPPRPKKLQYRPMKGIPKVETDYSSGAVQNPSN
jgi:hypothetical protein